VKGEQHLSAVYISFDRFISFFAASKVPRQVFAPQRLANCFSVQGVLPKKS
jgi:hypothetical protein